MDAANERRPERMPLIFRGRAQVEFNGFKMGDIDQGKIRDDRRNECRPDDFKVGEVAVLGNYLMPRSIVDQFEQVLLGLFQTKPLVELKEFRDATKTSRNVAVMVLEYFDVQGITKRQGNGRILARKSN